MLVLKTAQTSLSQLSRVVVPMALLCLPSMVAGQAKPAAQAPAAPAMTSYTAPDQSASAGVPAGWKVVSGAQTVITLTGPQGETVQLGNVDVAKDAPFQLGKAPGPGIQLSMPYSTPLAQKLSLVIQQGAAMTGKPAPQVTITSSTQIPIPATVGQCGRFVANVTGAAGAMDLLAVFCAMPMDAGGTYKNIMLLAQAPVATAAQSAPTARAIFGSYRIPATWLQKKLAPFQAAVAAPAGKPGAAPTGAAAIAEANAINRQTMLMMQGANNSANCFDLAVLRSTPTPLLPRSCGGNAP